MIRVATYTLLFATLFLIIIALTLVMRAEAHSWYPPECCSNRDCAPATKLDMQKKMATTSQGTGAIDDATSIRDSKDSQNHACIIKGRVVCLFLAPQI
jgi:hypothetical protein